MSTDGNICGNCDWQEFDGDESFNPRRRTCPGCGAEFLEREEIRWFA